MQNGNILYECRGPVVIITIDRPHRRNALSVGASVELSSAFDAFESNQAARIAILTGSGCQAFCAGGDLKQREPGVTPPATGFGGLTKRFDRTKPIIAAVNGLAFGGGFELALACDLIVGAHNATFALPEPRRGLMAMAGGLYRLPRAIGEKRALGIILTARVVGVGEALEMGLIYSVVSQDELMASAIELAKQIASLSPMAIRASLDSVRRGMERHSVEQAMHEQGGWPAVQALRNSEDRGEGITAFREKRDPRWQDR